jgi:hydroxymethylglutaryl-CoA lyase
MKTARTQVRIVEVGPRDGLQNEAEPIAVADRIELVNQLSRAGFKTIETGSFVSPKWIPQMAASHEVFRGIERIDGTRYTALTPNMKGLEGAIAAGSDEVAVFASATESFSQKNINCSIKESLERFTPVMAEAQRQNLPVRGYVSCVLGCPYEGEVDPAQVAEVTNALLEMGCYEISLGDTIGVGTPGSVAKMLDYLLKTTGAEQLALHSHDTYGQALANIHAALEHGLTVFDSCVSGLGGCPYAKGASGNVATEDLLYMLHGMGIETSIDLDLTIEAGQFISSRLGRSSLSKVAQARLAQSRNAKSGAAE